jgi:hypothetical protein
VANITAQARIASAGFPIPAFLEAEASRPTQKDACQLAVGRLTAAARLDLFASALCVGGVRLLRVVLGVEARIRPHDHLVPRLRDADRDREVSPVGLAGRPRLPAAAAGPAPVARSCLRPGQSWPCHHAAVSGQPLRSRRSPSAITLIPFMSGLAAPATRPRWTWRRIGLGRPRAGPEWPAARGRLWRPGFLRQGRCLGGRECAMIPSPTELLCCEVVSSDKPPSRSSRGTPFVVCQPPSAPPLSVDPGLVESA